MTELELAAKLVRHFEGCKLSAYQDSAGVWTIGWGHTRGVKPGDVIDQARADGLLADDLLSAYAAVSSHIDPGVIGTAATAALIDFAFNLGQGALAQLLSHSDTVAQIERWVHAGGQVLQGLVKRRAVEAFLFELGDL